MKTKKQYLNRKESVVETITPFAGFEDTEFFDDCPLCQELKREVERGTMVKMDLKIFKDEEEDKMARN